MTTKRSKDTITLGSGKLYIKKFTKGTTIPTHETIEVEENLAGYISGGASLEYTPEFYEAKDDLGIVSKNIVTAEEALFKSGIMTWNGNTLEQLSATGRVTEDANKRTVKIGGVANITGEMYLIRFVHTDKADGDVRITIVGTNQSGFTLTFSKDEATVIDAEFKALPAMDKDGTLIIFEETLGVTDPAVAQASAPASTEKV